MSAFQNLASPAPEVEAAKATPIQEASEPLHVEPARFSDNVIVEPAPRVEAAVTVDDPKKFAPPLSQEKAARLSVAVLRAGAGADFESKAAVIKGKVQRSWLRRLLSFIYDERDFVAYGEVARFVFVKGNCIFIYGQENDPIPLYTILLGTFDAVKEDPQKPSKDSFTISPRVDSQEARLHLVTVLLQDRQTKEQLYQITFDTSKDIYLAKKFLHVLKVNEKFYGDEIALATVVEPSKDPEYSKGKHFDRKQRSK